MAKRVASSDINQDNWDAPFEQEEPGTFKTATPEVLQKRVLKTAKRFLKSSSERNNTDLATSVFSSFTGFKPTTTTSDKSSTSKPFSFLSSTTSSSQAMPSNGSVVVDNTSTTSPQDLYLADLEDLNRSVSNWIKTHVDKNPCCILTPIFNDYEKHLKTIQEKRDTNKKDATSLNNVASTNLVSSSTSDSSKFTIDPPSTTNDRNKTSFQFTDTIFKMNSSDTNNLSSSILTEGKGKSPMNRDDSTDTKPEGFSLFSSVKSDTTVMSNLLKKPDPASLMGNPFLSTGNKQSPVTNSTKKEDEDNDSDEPPKVEFTAIEEEGAVFSTRCKVFVKKEDNYIDKGLGTIFIKKVGEEKYQLLVRGATVLGNILINTILTTGIRTQRMGKNNVMLVCIPTPQDPPPPIPVLLRVKTSADADELLTIVDKYKH